MPLDALPDALDLPQRDDIVRQYERDYKLRRPGAKTGDLTQVNVDAKACADLAMPLYARAAGLSRLGSLEHMSSAQLEAELTRAGLDPRFAATGAAGSVSVSASATGADVFLGDQLSIDGIRYQAAVARFVHDGDALPIVGVDTGSHTNQDAGKVLTWSSPRPGIGPVATVLTQGDGSGLIGGRPVESDIEIMARIVDARANPAASGNDADYQQTIRKTPGVPIQQVFTHPGILGPGTNSFVFTLRPAAAGGSRIPNATQIALAHAYVRTVMPADDTPLPSELDASLVDVTLKIHWSSHAAGWRDPAPWPPYVASSTAKWRVSLAGGALAAIVTDGNNGGPAPSVGNGLAFFDAIKKVFVRKTILTVAAPISGAYAVTFDPANAASDVLYVPGISEQFSPWSDTLASIVSLLVTQFDLLGPGEQLSGFFDDELRQRRSPPSPDLYPSVLTGRMLTPLYPLTAISDVQWMEPTLPLETPVGLPGSLSNLLVLGHVYAFPL